MLVLMAIWFLLVCAIAAGVAYVVVLVGSSLIIFSKIALSLLAALIAVQNFGITLVPDSGFLNYIAWLIVCLAAVFLLSMLPRVDLALKFFSTLFIGNFVIELVVSLFGSILATVVGADFEINLIFDVAIKIICLAFSINSWMTNTKKAAYDAPTNPVACMIDKIFAAVIYGVSLACLLISYNHNWELHWLVMLIILVGGAIAAFIADMRLGDKYLFAENGKTMAVPR